MKKYSRQREAVLSVLKNTTSHPTAGWVYEEVRKVIPNVSLGTVYRNLSELCATGDVMGFATGDGTEHFDGNTMAHPHFCCNECKRILDVDLDGTEDLVLDAEKKLNCEVNHHHIVFYGKCACCR